MSLSRQVTVRMPRPDGADLVTGWLAPPATPQSRLTWSPLAGRPLSSPTHQQPAAAPPVGHGRHRVRRSPGVRLAGFVLGVTMLGAAFGGGWMLGERWAPDNGASIAQQWRTTVDGLRDWALGL